MRDWMTRKCVTHRIAAATRCAVACAIACSFFETPDALANPDPEEQPAPATEPAPEVGKGTLIVTGTGAEPATLSVDGREVGPLPWTGEVQAGTHDIVAHSAHGISATRKVAVSANGRTELELNVVENPAKLKVTTGLPGAVIRVDGVPYANGKFDGDVPAGKHVVSVEHEGYVPSVIHLALNPDEQKNVDNVVLEKAPPVASKAPAGDRGLYTSVALIGMLGKATNSFNVACPADSLGGSCSSWVNLGGELDVHVGYSFGTFGVEGFVLGGTNLTPANQTFPQDVSQTQSPYFGIARKESYLIFEPIVGGGVAGRVSTKGKSYRLSTALGFGAAWRSAIVHRKVDATEMTPTGGIVRRDNTSLTPSGADRAVGLLIWDSDVQLGDTPGTRIFLGIRGQVELGSDPTIDLGSSNLGFTDDAIGTHLPLGGGALTIRRSPAFFIGPRLGVITGF